MLFRRSRPAPMFAFILLSGIPAVWAIPPRPTEPRNLIVNGNFEIGPPCVGHVGVAAGSFELKGWTVTGAGVDYVCTTWNDVDGNGSVDLNASENGGIQQTFDTISGSEYLVTFMLEANRNCGVEELKTVLVRAAGQEAQFSAAGMTWISETWQFTATAAQTIIEFSSLNGGACGPVIDVASVVSKGPPKLFRRGDANGDGRLDITDPIVVLRCLFSGALCGDCPDSLDSDDNGEVNVTDAISLLTWRFLSGPEPASPFPDCGPDPKADNLDQCEGYSCP